jgi:hypothetical protein
MTPKIITTRPRSQRCSAVMFVTATDQALAAFWRVKNSASVKHMLQRAHNLVFTSNKGSNGHQKHGRCSSLLQESLCVVVLTHAQLEQSEVVERRVVVRPHRQGLVVHLLRACLLHTQTCISGAIAFRFLASAKAVATCAATVLGLSASLSILIK